MLEEPPVVRDAFRRTVRLVSTARLRPPVLGRLVAPEDLAALAEIEGATSQRLIAERRGVEGVARGEFVFGVPYAAFVNAAFAYAKPKSPNRFNSVRGAWYAALAVETSLAEVAFHMTEFLAKTGVFEATVDYAELFASMSGEFVDLRRRRPSRAQSRSGDWLSARQRARRRGARPRLERRRLSVRAPPGRGLHRRAVAARRPVGGARRRLQAEMERSPRARDWRLQT